MDSFKQIWARAAHSHGGAHALLAALPPLIETRALAAKPDREFLSAMCRCVFQAGFAWHVVEAKWPGFEQAFLAFEPERLVALAPSDWAAFSEDRRIIRNVSKIDSVRTNATLVADIAREAGGFGQFLAAWPEHDGVGLLKCLAERGKRLGGTTGQRFLRDVGKDALLLDRDVVNGLRRAGLCVSSKPGSKHYLETIQALFNGWQEESGLAYQHLCLVVAASVDGDAAVA